LGNDVGFWDEESDSLAGEAGRSDGTGRDGLLSEGWAGASGFSGVFESGLSD